MNKHYKVIWSKVKNSYVVVSELAKQNGKSGSTKSQSGQRIGVALSVLALCAGLSGVANAATLGPNAMLAEVTGAGSSIKTEAMTQGATAAVYGPVNLVDATKAEFDGVANSVVGVANATSNANATLIFGAGNSVKNSYGNVDINLMEANAYLDDPAKLSEYLASKVGESGGQILVVGGANTVDNARFSSITGVSNKLLGAADGKSSEYNFISGAKNTVTGSDHAYVIGTDNAVVNATGNALVGDYRSINGGSNNVILGSGEKTDDPSKLLTTSVSNVVVAGYKANATVADGVAIGSNSIANVEAGKIGTAPTNTTVSDDDKKSATWTSTLGAVSVGYAADGTAPAGTRQITNVAAGTADTDAVNVAQLKALNTKVDNGAIHYYSTVSDKVDVGSNFANDGAKANDSIVIGINSSNTEDAVNSIVLGNGTTLEGSKNGTNGKVNSSVVVANGATINGIYNSVLATDYNNSPSGVATPTTVTGQHNTVIGAGNTVSGDQGVTIGTLNKVIGAYAIGQNNTVKSKGLAFGSNNTVGQTSEDGGIAIGRNLTVEGYEGVAIGGETQALADYSIAIGSGIRASEPSTVVEKAATQGIALGYGAKAKVSGGIALGAGSQATTAAKVKGYDPSTDAQSTNTTGVWQSGKGALSIGTPNNTRQITGVAAGWQNTDAVNVAQLKAARVKVEAATDDANSVTVSSSTATDGSTVYTISGVDKDTKVTGGTATYNQTTGAGTITVTDSSGNTTPPITITGLQDTYVTGATLKDGTLTLTRNAGEALTVKDIATKTDLAANKIEYFSVKSTETGNKNNAGATGTNAIAIGPKVTASGEGSVAIGFNNSMAGAGGVVIGRNTRTSGDSTVIIGDGAGVDPNISLDGHIAIGKNARAFAGGGEQEALLGFDPTNWPKRGVGGYDNPTDRSRVATGIAMGVNAKVRTGSIDIGGRTYNGLMGGKQVKGNDAIGFHVNQTAVGTNTYAKGLFSTMLGSYSIATGGFDGSGRMNTMGYGAQNFGATVVGSLNSIRSNGSGNLFSPSYQGIANTITGVGNITDNTNGSLVYGAGNKISNSITSINPPTSGAASVDAMVDSLQTAIRNSKSGGATMAFGGGNVADYARRTAIIGVNNTVTGTSSNISESNAITGFENTAKNVDYVTATGSNNAIENSSKLISFGNDNAVSNTEGTILMGDNRTVADADNSIILGTANKPANSTLRAAAATTLTTTAKNVVVMGYNANAEVDDGVALGSNSVANVDKEVAGYDPYTGKASENTGATWKSTLGSVSFGDAANNMTRQITGVAAGWQDTDAVNVAQLKAAKVSLVGGENISSISTAFTPENGTTYTINAVDTDTTITKGEITYNGSAGKLVLTDSNDKTLEITGLRDLDTTGVTLNGDTLTFTRNDGTTYTVGGLATATDLAANKIHYYSVNGPATPGGNYNNDGAKGANALAAGIGANASGNNAVAVGNNVNAVAHNSIAIGNGAWIADSNGGKGSGDIAIGNGAKVENYADQSAGISLGQNAYVENMAGKQEAIFALGQTTFSGNFLSTARIPADPSKVAAGISIGENSYARSGSLMVGTHKYVGQLGDVNIDTSTEKTRRAAGVGINNTTIGTNSFNGGTFSTITGSYSITTTNYAGGRNSIDAGKNFGSTIMGSLNSIESATATNSSSGVANSVVGFANRTFNSNGSLIFGAGNEITNSVTTISIPGTGLLDSSSAADSAKELQDKMKALVQRSNSGGATLAIGGGNKADYTRASSIIGVNNTLTGTANDISEYNSIMGYKNIAENVSNVTVAGINNTISNTTSAVVLGDNHKVTGANNSIVIGSADKETELTATDATVIGHNANTSINTAVALGSGSVAAVDKGVLGYIPTGKTLSDTEQAGATWTSTLGAVSVGVVGADGKATQTRQITGVAAGKADTDAVNVAQLQAVAAIAENAGTAAGKHTVVSVDGGKTAKDTTYVGDGNLQINVTSKDGQNTYDIKLSDKLTIGTKGEPGKDGEDGQPGTPGKAGTPGSITIIGENGKDAQGNELPEGNNTSADISVKDGAKGLDGKDGVTRIVYTDEGGNKHEVATMDDGLNFTGDTANVTISKKLNETLSIKGGITDESKLSDNNIGVVAQENGGLTVKLAKDLTGLTSINVGGTKGADGNYTGGITINNGGINMGGKQITNVASGIVNNDATDDKNAATIGDVKNLVTNQVNGSKAQTGKNITVDPNTNKVNLNDNITLGSETDKTKQVNVDGNGAKVTAGDGTNKVVVDGANGQVTIGNADNQIIMGNQEASPIDKEGNKLGTKENGQFITGLDNTTWEPDTKGYVPDRAATEGQLKDIADKINNIDTAVKDSSRAFAGDDGAKVTVKNGDTLHLNGGATNLSDGNIGVVARKDAQGKTTDILDIKLSKDLTGLNSVTTENLTVNKGANIGDVSIAGDTITVGKGDSQTIINDNSVKTGNTTINNDGLTVKGPEGSKDITIQNNNVSMGGNQIKNVGDAKDATDAVNKGQLDNVVNGISNGMGQMSNRISKLDNRVDRVGAGAAALAALHPLEFSPEAKWEVSAGVGNYRSANAVAIGAFYRPNGDTMFSIGTSLGGGENMVNAGVTLRVGDGETENYPARKVMAQEIKDLKSVVSQQSAQLEEQNQKIEQLLQIVATLQK